MDESSRERVVWGYDDLALFIGSWAPCWLIALLIVRPFRFPSHGVQTMAFQLCIYALLLGSLYVLISLRHGFPFWRALRWVLAPGSWLCLALGPVLAVGLGALGAALRAPEETAIQDLVTSRLSLIVVGIFGAILGPAFEEIVFRGFLFPLFARSLGPWPGILLAAAPFAVLHGPQNHWAWQSIVIIFLAGVIFGIARWRTGSTLAAALLHAGYNTTLFAVFIAESWPVR
ncbi:MAG: lysostaphin resistance A-like protein [Bryobacteraceae bacterium]